MKCIYIWRGYQQHSPALVVVVPVVHFFRALATAAANTTAEMRVHGTKTHTHSSVGGRTEAAVEAASETAVEALEAVATRHEREGQG